MRVTGLGHGLFALGLAGIGVLNLLYGDFAFQWQPVPPWVPWRETFAHLSGILLLICSGGMLLKRGATIFALIITAYLLVWVLLMHGPHVVAAPANFGEWLGFCESLALTSGGLILFASLVEPGSRLNIKPLAGESGARIGRILFAVSCLVFGASHFAYADATASMVPAWLPDRVGFAYLTGAGHFAAGLGLLLMVLPRLAATLEAIMMSCFVALVHIPGVLAAPTDRLQWTMLCIASALAGAGWIVAASLRSRPWREFGPSIAALR